MAGLTITEKIFMRAAGLEEPPVPGEEYLLKVDYAFGNDVTAPLAISQLLKHPEALKRLGRHLPLDRTAFFLDHFIPSPNLDAAETERMMRAFARQYGIPLFTGATHGIEHAYLPEAGLVLPGDVVAGADSHTCTYGGVGALSFGVGSTDLAMILTTGMVGIKFPEQWLFSLEGALQPWVDGKDLILYTIGQIGVKGAAGKTMEFTGSAAERLSMSCRLTMANMAIEAGATNGIFGADNVTYQYCEGRAQRAFNPVSSDPDAAYAKTVSVDVSAIEPQVAFPFLPENARPVSEAAKQNIAIQQVVIGSCTGGRLEDFEAAAKVLEGRHLHPDVRGIALPGTATIYLQLQDRGILRDLVKAGFNVSTPTCGPCLGAFYGLLAPGERAVATTNRNFNARMGHTGSEVYLANAAVAAASGVLGRIAHPKEVV
ncbi:3-isopropylmalate dehydratase large subunit [Candidatus Woesearchaeota archaeon]|nr:3-isopropylmalate dehydratase large subunit [Candidatus Woesearchaeota archaeon]